MSNTAAEMPPTPNLPLPAPPLSPFHALIPTNLEPVEVPAPSCGNPDCDGGWLWTASGAVPCQACQSHAAAERLALQYERAGVDGTLFHQTWDGMHLEHDSWRVARAYGENIAAVFDDCVNLVFVGEVGRGKTQAGVLLAKDALAAGHSALVVSWAEWVDDVMSDYSRRARTQAEHIADLAAPDLLVLDDVGAGATQSGDLERKLFTRVIDARYKRRRPTVMTSNLETHELQKAMGERAFDRIQHACDWVIFDGPTYRAEVERGRVRDTIARIRQAAGA